MDRIGVKSDIFKQAAFISIIILGALVLRFVNLGYSNYQGDEIKALFIKGENQSSFEFLLDQRKGPGQFLVTRAIQVINPRYQNHLITRLPFALASLLSVLFFYLFVKNLYNDLIAFFSTLFFVTNGIIVGLSRIVQYQSLVFFFTTLTLASLVFAVKKPKFQIWGLYIGLFSWSLAMLSHYDGIFIAPMVLYLLYRWIKESKLNSKAKYSHLLVSGIVSFLLLLIFYVPYAYSISQSNLSYLLNRVQVNPLKEKTGSIIIFKNYQPVLVFNLYFGMAILGITYILISFLKQKVFRDKFFNKVPDILGNNKLISSFVLIIWYLFPYVFLEGIVHDPGTHIYNYLVPLFIIMGIGLWFIVSLISSFLNGYLGKVLIFSGISVLLIFLFVQSYFIFIDHYKEYPWESKEFLFWKLEIPLEVRLPLFGFPYYRNWEGINQFLTSRPEKSNYLSNEKQRISEFYLTGNIKKDNYIYMIYIRNPQTRLEELAPEFAELFRNETPIYTYEKNGQIYSAVFRIRRNYFE